MKLKYPEDWEVKLIEDFSKVSTGDKDTVNKVDGGKYPFFVRSQQIERIDSYSYDGEAILTAGDGVGVGKVFHYINGKFDYHQRVYKISDFKDVDGKYFFYFFSMNFMKQVKKYNAKTSVDSVRREMITKMKVPIPTFVEQQKIASILSTWDKAIELKEKLIEQKKEQKKGLMQKLLTGEVRLPGYDGEWKEVKLAKVSKRTKGKAVEYLEDGKFPAIDMDYLESRLFKNFSNDATVFAKKNDVLLLWDGSRAGMAFTGVEGAVGSTFVKLECKSIHNIFLQKHLEMNERKIQRLREGSGIPHVPKDFLNFYKIKMPSMDEQQAISNVLNNMDKDLEFLQKEIVYLKQQKQGLMQQLLSGKVRVKV